MTTIEVLLLRYYGENTDLTKGFPTAKTFGKVLNASIKMEIP